MNVKLVYLTDGSGSGDYVFTLNNLKGKNLTTNNIHVDKLTHVVVI